MALPPYLPVDVKWRQAPVRASLEVYWPLSTILFVPSMVFALLACFLSQRLQELSLEDVLMMVFSAADIVVVTMLAMFGILMQPSPLAMVLALLAATLVFALLLDQVKVALFRHPPID